MLVPFIITRRKIRNVQNISAILPVNMAMYRHVRHLGARDSRNNPVPRRLQRLARCHCP